MIYSSEHPTSPSSRRLLLTFMFLLLPFSLAENTAGQSRELFDVSSVVVDAKRRYNLSSRDLKAIQPFIEREKGHLVRIFARFNGGDVPEYSFRLWTDLITHRHDTEIMLSAALTSRQASAMRSARTRLETRVIDFLVEEYVVFLGQYLLLGDLEFDEIVDLFKAESRKNYALIGRHLQDPKILRMEIENTNKFSLRRLEKILDKEQWRAYLLLQESTELVG